MNKKIVFQFLVLTFALALASYGILSAFGMCGLTIANTPWLYVIFAIGGWSPPIASYIVLKKNNKVSGFKEWIGNIFAVRRPLRFYLLIILFVVISDVSHIIFTGFGEVQPWYMFLALLPMSFIAGGNEEMGWSYALRPELEKKFGFIISTVIFTIIWTLWHIPMFLPQEGRIETLSWFGILSWFGSYSLSCLGWSFTLGAIRRITKSVWLCVLYHTIIGASYMTLYPNSKTLAGEILSTCLLILVSVTAVFIHTRKSKSSMV